jgi:hypothetical protein
MGCRFRFCRASRRSTRSSSTAGPCSRNPSSARPDKRLRSRRRSCPRWHRRRCNSSPRRCTGCPRSRARRASRTRGRRCWCRCCLHRGTCRRPSRSHSMAGPSGHSSRTILGRRWWPARYKRRSWDWFRNREGRPRHSSRTRRQSKPRRRGQCRRRRGSCKSRTHSSRHRRRRCRRSTATRASRRPGRYHRHACRARQHHRR